MDMNKVESLTFDIITTNKCNLSCKYCIENEHISYHDMNCCNSNIDSDFVSFIDKCYSKLTDAIKVNFWGGEPTLKIKSIDNILSYYYKKIHDDDININFFISTNGYASSKLIDIANKYKHISINNNPFFKVQVSYDGEPINSLKRTDNNGKASTEKAVNTIKTLQDKRIPYTLKSTLTYDMLPHLYEAYCDIINNIKADNYFPTLDYRIAATESITGDMLLEYKSILKEQLLKIAVDEIKYMRSKATPISRFAWFNYNRAECQAGNSMYVIDTDGNVYQCHGCLLIEDKNEHLIGNIKSAAIYDNIVNNIEKYSKAKLKYNNSCDDCDAIYCLRCNAAKWAASNKSDYYERWFDYKSQDSLCALYRYISSFARAVKAKCDNS